MKKRSSCTSILIGRKATVDGTLIIGRNEDCGLAFSPVQFVYKPSVKGENRSYKMHNKEVIPLPSFARGYTALPEKDVSVDGTYASAGFNEAFVGMSATESLYGATRALAFDPLVEKGIAEEAIPDLVLPYIESAKDGVIYLGKLIETYGSAEGNGVLFIDHRELWYMEIPTGHHWLAVKIPEDSVAVAPNMACIQEVDLNDSENVLYSRGLLDFVNEHHLNKNREGFNFREIFGTQDASDRIYNTARAWDAMRVLAPQTVAALGLEPYANDIPFIYKAEKLLDVTDAARILSLHFDETDYDPLGKDGSGRDRTRYRPIAVSKTQESHLLQVNPQARKEASTVLWLSLGTTAYSPYIPFFSHIRKTPAAYRNIPKTVDFNSAYWLYRTLDLISENQRFDDYMLIDTYNKEIERYTLNRVKEIEAKAREIKEEELLTFFEKANNETAKKTMEISKKHLSRLLQRGFERSKLSFKMNPDL